MKRLLIFFYFLTILSFWANAQVTLNQVTLKYDSSGWDSAFVNYTSFLGKPAFIGSTKFPDPSFNCYNDRFDMVFRGSLDTVTITADTALRVGYFGLITNFFSIEALWDTSSNTVPPSTLITMDSFIQDSCYTTNVREMNKGKYFSIYPNPNKGIFKIYNALSETFELTVYNLQGKKLKEYKSDQEYYDLSDLSKGVYIITIQSEKERFVKKVMIN